MLWGFFNKPGFLYIRKQNRALLTIDAVAMIPNVGAKVWDILMAAIQEDVQDSYVLQEGKACWDIMYNSLCNNIVKCNSL